jgi:hypothetical protein
LSPSNAPTLGGLVSIVDFGGNGNGVADNLAAFNAAVAKLQSTPPGFGTIYFPPGTYYVSTSYTIPSGIHLQGAGQSATTLISDGHHYAVQIISLLTGTGIEGGTITYPINAPTQGGNTVTTTNSSDAGNFNPGDTIFVSGSLHSTAFWFPSFTTTVLSSNAGTGLITLNETLPIGGVNVQLVQKVVNYVTDVRISDLTINIPSGAVTGGMQAVIARNVVLERVASRTMATTRHSYMSLAGVRDGYVNDCLFVAGYVDFLGCIDTSVINNTVQSGVIVFDGGTLNSTLIGNTITDAQDPQGTPNSAIAIGSDAQNNRIIGNVITGQSGVVGIGLGASNDDNTYGGNTVIGNIIYGTGTASATGISVGSSTNNIVIGNNINTINTGIRLANNSIGTIVHSNKFTNIGSTGGVPNTVLSDGTSGVNSPLNDIWNVVPAGTTSPNIAFGSLLQTANTAATSITGFTGGNQGQEATLWVNDAFTTLVYSGTFLLAGLVNFTPPSGTIIKFSYRNGVWREVSRSVNAVAAATFPRGIVLPESTVATLPAAGQAGRKQFVTDATVTTFGTAVVGGGANVVPVYDNGTTWMIG